MRDAAKVIYRWGRIEILRFGPRDFDLWHLTDKWTFVARFRSEGAAMAYVGREFT